MTNEGAWLWSAAALAAVVVGVIAWILWLKGRPFAKGDIFRASRLSSGNRLFPTQVLITPTSVVQYTPRWIGKLEETINVAHVASVKIITGLFLSDVLIETSGGTDPILCHGHTKRDAVRMKDLIEQYQTAHYRGVSPQPRAAPTPGPGAVVPDRSRR